MSEIIIGSTEYRLQTVLATKAITLQMRIMKILGGSISKLPEILGGAGPKATKQEKDKSNAAALAAFMEIFSNSEPVEMMNLVKDIVEMAEIKRPSGYSSVNLDGDFSGKLDEMLKLVVFVLREIFSDFFSGLKENGFLKTQTKG